MASVASLRLGRVTVALGKGVKAADITKIVGIVKGKYGCLACGFVGKLKDLEGIRSSIKGMNSVEKISISLQ